MYSGMVIGIFMVVVLFLFKNFGWKGMFSVTSKIVIVFGWVFFGMFIYVFCYG